MPNKELQFSHRLFQRGLTRRECIEGWSFNRPSFLAQLKKTQPLDQFVQVCNRYEGAFRVAMVYSPRSLDSFFVLPYVMESFNECRHGLVRYFAYEHFFPLFYQNMNRVFPQIFLLDHSGIASPPWGPRANGDVDLSLDDEGLSQFAIKHYPDKLDESLAAFFSRQFGF